MQRIRRICFHAGVARSSTSTLVLTQIKPHSPQYHSPGPLIREPTLEVSHRSTNSQTNICLARLIAPLYDADDAMLTAPTVSRPNRASCRLALCRSPELGFQEMIIGKGVMISMVHDVVSSACVLPGYSL